MKKANRIIWGVALVAVGIIVALKALDVIHFDLFFDGWWTLFIIVPSVIGLVTEKGKAGSLIGLCIGVLLLLGCQDVFGFEMVWKLGLPIIIVVIGLQMVFSGIRNSDGSKLWKEIEADGKKIKTVSAVFSGSDMDLGGETVEGVKCTTVFGGIKCDLTRAVLEKDCVINATAVFGGVDIFVPENVNVKIHSNSLFGGVDNETHKNAPENTVTVYINANCVFGGVEVK